MRKIYLSIISILVMTTISSCMTTSGFLTQSKLNESNRRFQQEQLSRAEEAKREISYYCKSVIGGCSLCTC